MILTPPFVAVVPIALPLASTWTDTEPATLPPIAVDPLAWSRDGSWWPPGLRVKPVEDGRTPQFVKSHHYRKWQAILSGPNAAKATKKFLEVDSLGRFGVDTLNAGDVLEVGRVNRSHRANLTSFRCYYVVAERTETRLVLAFSTSWTKAAALRIGNLRKALGAERESMLASRAAIFEDLNRERSSAEVEDDDAIADVFM